MILFIIVLSLIAGGIILAKSLFGKRGESNLENSQFEPAELQEVRHNQQPFQNRDGVFVLNRGKASQITLIGATESVAKLIKTECDNLSSYYEATKSVRDILLENKIELAEVSSFQKRVRPIVERRVNKLISEDDEWASLGEMDKKDKRMEYAEKSMVSFKEDVTPAVASALSVLVMKTPHEVPLLKELIHDYGVANINTYSEYVGRKNPIISIPNPSYRKPLERLVKAGIACTGNDMSVEELLSSLKLNELNDIIGTKSKFTRKDKAIKYIVEKADVASIIESRIALRSLFMLKPLPSRYSEFDFNGYKELQSYYEALAEVVISLYHGYSSISFK